MPGIVYPAGLFLCLKLKERLKDSYHNYYDCPDFLKEQEARHNGV